MKRREFLAASAAALACTARLAADENAAERPREPDLVLEKHSGAVAFSPDSKVLAVANGPIGNEQGICFLDVNTGKRLADYERATYISEVFPNGWPAVIAFSPDGKYFAAGREGFVALWDAESGKRLPDLTPKAGNEWGKVITEIGFTPDSQRVFVAGSFWRLDQRSDGERVNLSTGYDGFAFSPTGKLFATRSKGIITVWEYPSLQKHKEFGRERLTSGPLIFSGDRKHIASRETRIDGRSCFFWNIDTGEPKYIAFEFKPSSDFDLSPDGSALATVTDRGTVIMSVETGHATQLLKDGPALIGDLLLARKFAPDQRALVCSWTSGIRLWRDKNAFKS
jgi:WD40 repeat protein